MTAVVRAALAAVEPGDLVRQALAMHDIDRQMRAAGAVDVVAVGKASGRMLAAVVAHAPVPLRHVVGISHVAADVFQGARWHTTGHPVPNQASVAAARDVMNVASAARNEDALLVLLSGGASAMMALPAVGISLHDKQRTTERLLTMGAEIRAFNAVRKHLSAIKGGLLAAANLGSTLTLAISDVVGDDLSTIGSGPGVADPSTFDDARDALARYGGDDTYPQAVVKHLRCGVAGEVAETPKPGDARLARAEARVIGGLGMAIAGARAAAASLGYPIHVIAEPSTGDAQAAAHSFIQRAKSTTAEGPVCILAGGETTVRTDGSGKGGRNQEFALAMARELHILGPRVVAASVGTDGIDGPTDAAGAVVDTSTLPRAAAANLGPVERYLDRHCSYLFFDELNDLIRTGPTGTNVGDLHVILVGGRQ